MWVVLISHIRIVCALGVPVLLGCLLCEEWLLAFSTHLSLQNHVDSAISFSPWCMWAITFLLLHGPVAAQVALVCKITMVCLASRPSLHWLTVPYVHSTKHIQCMMVQILGWYQVTWCGCCTSCGNIAWQLCCWHPSPSYILSNPCCASKWGKWLKTNQQPTPNDNSGEWWSSFVVLVSNFQ